MGAALSEPGPPCPVCRAWSCPTRASSMRATRATWTLVLVQTRLAEAASAWRCTTPWGSLRPERAPSSHPAQALDPMPTLHEIRADHDAETIVVYQAYAAAIAEPAIAAQRFVAPFSFGRMTWIKPSFLWLMHRSNWGRKVGQERILAVRIRRTGWDQALSLAVLTSPEAAVFRSPDEWTRAFAGARVHIQWDTERNVRGGALPYYSIQIGLGRDVIRDYVEKWIVAIEDRTTLVRKMYQQLQGGHADSAAKLLPRERPYAVDEAIGKRLLIDA